MKPWQYWIVFLLAAAVLFAAMGWVSLTALRLDRMQAESGRKAAFEENVRLALWRMETAVAPLLAREGSRPYFVYAPFYPAERAYTKMFEPIPNYGVMVPSPLLTEETPQVLLHFQIDPDGRLTSPQVPAGRMRELSVSAYDNGVQIGGAALRLADLEKKIKQEDLLAALPAETDRVLLRSVPVLLANAQPAQTGAQQTLAMNNDLQEQAVGWQGLNASELESRQSAKNVQEYNVRAMRQAEMQRRGQSSSKVNPAPAQGKGDTEAVSDVREGTMKALWVDDWLVLARRVTVNGKDYIQGCWVDWPGVRDILLRQVRDLFVEARLQPVPHGEADRGGRMLAGIPVRFFPGRVSPTRSAGFTAVQVSLWIAWGCVLVAAATVGLALAGAVALSERRGAFVSAVTHELRTPLTTFRMYAEMLAEGMIKDEAKRQRYLQTLCAEGDRLHHLVENVLSYARLERGRACGQTQVVAVGAVLDRVRERLEQRAGQAGMALEWAGADAVAAFEVRTDASAVDQVLFNLVDNACKYAAQAADKRITVEAAIQGRWVCLRVRDRGPGIPEAEARRLFRPFHKSAQRAAETAPGVGLGLALSRRLARQTGGDLRMCGDGAAGACFELLLPRAGKSRSTPA